MKRRVLNKWSRYIEAQGGIKGVSVDMRRNIEYDTGMTLDKIVQWAENDAKERAKDTLLGDFIDIKSGVFVEVFGLAGAKCKLVFRHRDKLLKELEFNRKNGSDGKDIDEFAKEAIDELTQNLELVKAPLKSKRLKQHTASFGAP